jgi:hypothetical protein
VQSAQGLSGDMRGERVGVGLLPWSGWRLYGPLRVEDESKRPAQR